MPDPKITEITDIAKAGIKDKNYHSNSIIDSKQEYSMLEKRMIYFVINQLDISPQNVQKDLFNDICFKIPVSAFGEDYSFKTLKAAINKITNRSITGGDNKKQHAFSINPFPFAEVKNGMVELVMYSKAVPLFIDLKTRGYTSYELDVALSLKSVYSQRLYELLVRFKDTGKWYVEIERFKFLLGIDKEKSFNGTLGNGKIKATVIEPSMKELAEKTEINFDYCFEKTGRKYTAITFIIKTKKLLKFIKTEDANQNLQTVANQLRNLPANEQMPAIIQALSDYNFSYKQKENIKRDEKMISEFFRVHLDIIAGVVEIKKDKTSYMASVLMPLGLNK